jgi:Fe-Mn family superoxide dismutase
MTDLYTLPDLPYDYAALEPVVSGRIMELHHDKHHAAYVKGANAAIEQLATKRKDGDFATITMLEKNLAFHVSGHVLHSVFWTNLSPDPGEPEASLTEILESTFGGVDTFRRHMTQAAASVQGSGWALAAWEPIAGRMIVQQVHDHQGNHGQGTIPLLAIDAWEHAYYLQYENDKAAFFDAIWGVIDWGDVSRRLEAARSGDLVDSAR